MIDVMALALVCCPDVAPSTMAAIVQYESASNPFAININGPVRLSRQPDSLNEAIAVARRLTAAHLSFDSGLGQVNSVNVLRFKASWREVFDGCGNLKLAARVLTDCYKRAAPARGQQRLARALSCYNTGNYTDGFDNGYVSRVYQVAHARPRR